MTTPASANDKSNVAASTTVVRTPLAIFKEQFPGKGKADFDALPSEEHQRFKALHEQEKFDRALAVLEGGGASSAAASGEIPRLEAKQCVSANIRDLILGGGNVDSGKIKSLVSLLGAEQPMAAIIEIQAKQGASGGGNQSSSDSGIFDDLIRALSHEETALRKLIKEKKATVGSTAQKKQQSDAGKGGTTTAAAKKGANKSRNILAMLQKPKPVSDEEKQAMVELQAVREKLATLYSLAPADRVGDDDFVPSLEAALKEVRAIVGKLLGVDGSSLDVPPPPPAADAAKDGEAGEEKKEDGDNKNEEASTTAEAKKPAKKKTTRGKKLQENNEPLEPLHFPLLRELETAVAEAMKLPIVDQSSDAADEDESEEANSGGHHPQDLVIFNAAWAIIKYVNYLSGYDSHADVSSCPVKRVVPSAKELQKMREAAERKRKKLIGSMDDLEVKPRPMVLRHDLIKKGPTALGMPMELFNDVLNIWTFLVSVPRALKLSQFSLQKFVASLQESDCNAIVEETCKALMVINDFQPSRSKHTCINVLDCLAELVGYEKPKPPPKRGRKYESSSEEEDSDESSEEDDESDDEDMCPLCSKEIGAKASVTCQECVVEYHTRCLPPGKAPRLTERRNWVCPKCVEGVVEEDEEEEESEDEEEKELKAKKAREEAAKKKAAEEEAARNEAAEKEAAAAAEAAREPTEEEVLFRTIKERVEELRKLRSYCSWPNIELKDRISMIAWLCHFALNSPKVFEEAAKLQQMADRELGAASRKAAQIKGELTAKREKKAKAKEAKDAKESGSAAQTPVVEEPPGVPGAKQKKPKLLTAADRAEIESAAQEQRTHIMAQARLSLERGDLGIRVVPLGMDRFKRLYWRFPCDNRILVQFTHESSGEALEKQLAAADGAKKAKEEEEEHRKGEEEEGGDGESAEKRGKKRSSAESLAESKRRQRRGGGGLLLLDDEEEKQQKEEEERRALLLKTDGGAEWGVIAAQDVEEFCEGLEERGVRESALRTALQQQVPIFDELQQEQGSGRIVTRARAQNMGYNNRFAAFSL